MRRNPATSRNARLRPWVAVCSIGSLGAIGGCASSPRLDFLAMRQAAPMPEKANGMTLAEAEMSNVGPARPPTALATGR